MRSHDIRFTALSMRLFALLLFLAGCGANAGPAQDISQAQLLERINAKTAPLIIDVRSPEEYAQGHVPGAINIPHDQMLDHLDEVRPNQNQEIVLYCKSGRRAGIAADSLAAKGFEKLRHLQGDMNAWHDKGLPIER